ncbi:MAG: DUF3617 family protein [Steroidobacteraceae bacterium]
MRSTVRRAAIAALIRSETLIIARKTLPLMALTALALFASRLALTQAVVPGVKYRQTTTMEMMGMSIPSTTREVCVSNNDADEALAMPSDECELTSVQRSPNGFKAQMRCTGEQAMEGSLEQVSDGPGKYRTTMRMSSAEGDMTMKMTSVKLGQACDANADFRKFNAMANKMQKQAEDNIAENCRQIMSGLKKKPGDVAYEFSRAFSPDGSAAMCGRPEDRKAVCAALNTRAGFLETKRAFAKGFVKNDSLQSRLSRCTLGKEDTVRQKLLAGAEAAGDWEFLISEGLPLAQALADRECTGRGFTFSAQDPRYTKFCSSWSAYLAGRDFGGDNAGDADSSSQVRTSAAGESGDRPGATGAADNEAATGNDENQEPKPATATDKAKELGKSAKKVLGRIFGGGN